MKRMVAIISDYETAGGAAVAARRIETSLRLAAPDWRIARVAFFGDGGEHAIHDRHILQPNESPLATQVMRLPRKLMPGRFPRLASRAFAERRLRQALRTIQPDVIQLNNLHGATDWGWGPWIVETCVQFAPVVWTLHDMWSFTGRCAYAYDCDKFVAGCDASCETAGEYPRLAPERIAAAWRERRALFARNRVTIVTPSRWLASQARRGLFADHRIEVIPYGVPRAESIPRDEARQALGLPADGLVLLLAAVDLSERRKGAEIMQRIGFDRYPMTLLTMGAGSVNVSGSAVRVHALGFVADPCTKALAYAAADALLHPAPADNFPNTVLEAMASGTPTIALPVGGLPEIVRPGETGWLAERPTGESLTEAIEQAARGLDFGVELSHRCRAIAGAEYSMELQGQRYRRLIEGLTKTEPVEAVRNDLIARLVSSCAL